MEFYFELQPLLDRRHTDSVGAAHFLMWSLFI
jgi:hypothetical protein